MNQLISKKSQMIAKLSVVWLIITLLSEIILYLFDAEGMMILPVFVSHLLWVLSVAFMLTENISVNLHRANLFAAIAPNAMFVLFMLSLISIQHINIPRQVLDHSCQNMDFYRTTLFGRLCNIIEYGTGILFALSYITSIIVWIINTYIVLRAHKLINIKNIFNFDKY